MSLLTVVQEFCRRTGLSVPSSVVTSNNPQTLQILGLCNELVTEMVSDRYSWRALQQEATFLTIAGESQGSLYSLAGDGYLNIIPGTIWNRSQNVEICGPLSPEEWQIRKAMPQTGTAYYYRIRGEELLFHPPVSNPGETIAFEYRSDCAVKAADGTLKPAFTADTDTLIIPEHLLSMGLRWKWKEEKGLEFNTAYQSWASLVRQSASGDGTKEILDMTCTTPVRLPGILVPYGSYNQ